MNKMTIVFKVVNKELLKDVYEAHRNGTSVFGMIPEILAWGDQVSTPSDIVDMVIDIDPDFPEEKELKKIYELAIMYREQERKQ